MQRITITIDDDLLAALDGLIADTGYANRSEAVRDAVRASLAARRTEDDGAPCVGCVVYVYDHRERSLSNKLVKAQHAHHDVPAATLHLHIDAANCLEATVLRGTVDEVRRMADGMISQTGIKHGHLHMIPMDD